MPRHYLSPALAAHHGEILSLGVPLIGVEADIYNGIWDAIIDRKLKPGVKIEEAALCEIYGISRTVIRKVLVIMEQEGIVYLPVNRGAYIAKPTPQDAEDLLEAMQTLVTYFVRKLATASDNRRLEACERLSIHLEAERQAILSSEVHTRRRLRLEFDAVLGLLCGNRIQMANYMRSAIQLSLALVLYQHHPVFDPAIDNAQMIIETIRYGRADEAAGHVDTTYKNTRLSLDFDPGGDVADLKAILGKDRA